MYGCTLPKALSTVGVMATATFDNINPFEHFLPAHDADLDFADTNAICRAQSDALKELFEEFNTMMR